MGLRDRWLGTTLAAPSVSLTRAVLWSLAVWLGLGSWGLRAALLEDYTIQYYNKERNLPFVRAQRMFQARDGHLWVASHVGLIRFDGLRWVILRRASHPGMAGDNVVSVTEDAQGDIWAGLRDRGIVRFRNLRQVAVKEPPELFGRTPFCIIPRRAGGVWVGMNYGVGIADDAGLRMVDELAQVGRVHSLLEDARGHLWVGTTQVDVYDPGAKTVLRTPVQPGNGEWEVGGLHLQDNGKILATVANAEGVRVYECGDEGSRLAGWVPQTVGVHARGSALDRRGDLWLSGDHPPLVRWCHGASEATELTWPHAEGYTACVLGDYEGGLWVGSDNSGLQRLTPRLFYVVRKEHGLSNENTWAVLESGDGSWWAGTDGGVFRFASSADWPAKGRAYSYQRGDGLARNTVRALAEDAQGVLWIGTGEGISFYRDGAVTSQRFEGFSQVDDFNALGANKVRVIRSLGAQGMLVASPRGIHWLRAGGQTFLSATNGLPHEDVREILPLADGTLWLASAGGGVARVQLAVDGGGAGRVQVLDRLTRTNGLRSDFTWTLHQDAPDSLWIGTEAGLHWYHRGRITAFTARLGLFDELINSLVEDDEGGFWIGCDRAIYRVRKEELVAVAEGRLARVHSEPFDEEDGLASTETNGQKSQPAAWKTRDGRLLFATTHGLAVVNPRQARAEHLPPPRVVIQQVLASGRVVYGDEHSEEGVATTSRLDRRAEPMLRLLPQEARALELRYAATTFSDPARIQFQHRLDGYDDGWRDAGSRRTAFYGHLPPGDYRFRVRAANRHNRWNAEGVSLAFHVTPAFHQTWTFWGLAALALAAGVLVFVRWRLSEMRRIQRLELKVVVAEERSRIARDLHDGLGADLSQITLLAEVAARHSSRPDLVESRLTQLGRVARDAGQALRDLIWVSSPASETLEGVVNRICQRAEEFLSAAGIGYRFDVPLDWPELQLDVAVRQNLRYVAREILNNVVRHSHARLVRIRARLEEGWLVLAISDDGCGYDPAAQSLAPGAQAGTATGADFTRGMGLGNMRDRMREVGGVLVVESQPGSGTCVRVRVPVGGKAAAVTKPG